MPYHTLPTQFSGKTWIFIVQALVFGGLGVFSLVMGPLFLFGIMTRADGRPGTDAGIALTILSIPFLLVFALALFNVVARRRPILRVCREGLELNMIGSSSLDGIPLIPGLIRVAWLIISFKGFKQQIVRAPWKSLRHVEVSGPPMAHTLTIVASILQPPIAQRNSWPPIANQIAFREVAFDAPLDQIADTINAYSQNIESHNHLPSWSD